MVSNLSTSLIFFAPVQEQLLQVEEVMRVQADGCHPDLGIALHHLLASGGKRIRPAVALLTGSMLGGDMKRLTPLAAAVELLHTATLVHDDLIDGAFLRRGSATLNAQWSPAATVLSGDFFFARAAHLAAETGVMELMCKFAETLAVIVNGEITQLFAARGIASRENYDQRIYAKTASLFELCTLAAAMLSPVDAARVETVRGYGYSIGMAFQIVDDVLDFTGEQATVGKPVASDLRQGLVTLPALLYLETHPGDPDMQQLLAGATLDEAQVTRLVQAIRASGAIRQALQEAEGYVQGAVGGLAALPATQERHSLEELARYIVARQV